MPRPLAAPENKPVAVPAQPLAAPAHGVRTRPALERKSGERGRFDFLCELKFSGDDAEDGTVEGYGSVFGLLDLGGDIVEAGAFKASIADWKKKKALPPMLWQHDPDCPIGVWTDLAEDEKGLKVTGKLILDVPQAANARALLKGGAIKGLSIGYMTKDAQIDRTTGARRLKKVDLWEISLVTFPMLPEAQVTGAKTTVDFDPRTWERAFRDGGLSTQDAKAAVSVARKMALRDGGQAEQAFRDGMKDTLMQLRKTAEALR